MSNVREWLTGLGFGQFADTFEKNRIDLDIARELVDQDLRDLGVSALGERKLLLRAIASLKETVQESPAEKLPAQTSIPAQEGERRQLTVLFCDMVGFTELANRVDPEVLQQIIRAYEDACAVCITRYEGYVFQRLGDGIVAFFGYPLAHEGEAERAIRAGLEIIDALSKLDVPDASHLAVRIGIATGLVVVSSAEKGAVGETMNLASRLQAIAQPGSIVVSERVRRLAGGSFEYEDLRERALKGLAHPTHVYRIVGVSEAVSRFEAATQEGLTPLVGREQEIALLLERWALAQDGEGQVVLLSGEPGIGKSRILSALRERLEGQGAQTLRLQCSPYYVNSALWPNIDNFERALKFGRDESPESKLDKLEALMVGHYGRPLSDVCLIASMLSIPCEPRYGAISLTPQKHKDETLRSLVDLTEAAARKQPSVMLYEDVHWADPTTLEVMDLLIDRVKGIPLLVVLTHRPEFQNRWSSHGHVAALNLSKLTRAQSGAMVSRVARGKAFPGELLDQILTKTDGVPLFVEELTKSILESGDLKDAGDHYEYAGATHGISIPATLRDSLMARLDRFAPVKEIAQIGAAIGREFSYELIAAVAPMTQTPLDAALSQLTDSGLAFRRGTPPDAVYTFKHALVQDAAYDSLLKSKRAQLHARIAEVLEKSFSNRMETEPELLAYHFQESGNAEVALHYWTVAGDLAAGRSAGREAAAYYRAALQALSRLPAAEPSLESQLSLQLKLGSAVMQTEGYASPATYQCHVEARELAKRLGQFDKYITALAALNPALYAAGKFREAARLFNDFPRGDLRNLTSVSQVVRATSLGISRVMCGELGQGLDHLNEARKLDDETPCTHENAFGGGDPAIVIRAYSARACAFRGLLQTAERHVTQGLEIANRRNHSPTKAWAMQMCAWLAMFTGDHFAAMRHAKELLELSERLGFQPRVATALFYVGRGNIVAGNLQVGIPQLREGYALWASAGGKFHCSELASYAADDLLRAGCPEEASAFLIAAEEIQRNTDERIVEGELLRLRGALLELQQRPEAAEEAYRCALDTSVRSGAALFALRAATAIARLYHATRRENEATAVLAPLLELLPEAGALPDALAARDLLSRIRSDRE